MNFSEEIQSLSAVVMAEMDEAGMLVRANTGFLRLLSQQGSLPQPGTGQSGVKVSWAFIQPDFATLLAGTPDSAGLIHQGLMTVGHRHSETTTLVAKVWHRDGLITVLAEHDIAELARLSQTVLALNEDYAKAQFELAQTNLQMRQINAELDLRVARQTQSLQDALFRAEAAVHAKSTFLGTIGHELRTPLNIILGLGHVIATGTADAALGDKAQRVMDAGHHLLSMINDLLSMSRADSEPMQWQDFSVREVLANAVEAMRTQAEAKGLGLDGDSDPGLPDLVRGDPQLLGKVLARLLDNAVKFSERGHIRVRARADAMQGDKLTLRLEVEDEGPGIAPAQQAGIFNAFGQLDGSLSREHGGTGIGLALCRQWVQMMSGTIGVQSSNDRGSTFWFTLPVQRSQATAHASGAPQTRAPVATKAEPVLTPIDWPGVRAASLRMELMLEVSDFNAANLWHQSAALLSSMLGDRLEDFGLAMDAFDFPGALRLLRQAMADHPA